MIKKILTIVILTLFSASCALAQDKDFHLYPNYITYLKAKDSLLKNDFYFKASTNEKIVCLSFDDGPSLAYTEKLTALLKQKMCPAVFFIVGNNVKNEVVKFYKDTLFEIGTHSFNHYDYRKVFGIDTIVKDFKNSVDLHKALRFGELKWYRPPHGVINDTVANIMKGFGLQGVLWSFDIMDFLSPTEQEMLNNIEFYLSNGDIILLHEKINLTTLNHIIDLIRKKGFKIVKLSELIKHQNIIP